MFTQVFISDSDVFISKKIFLGSSKGAEIPVKSEISPLRALA